MTLPMSVLNIPVQLGPPPLAPWLRFAMYDSKVQVDPQPYAPIRSFRDFSLYLMVDGHNWVWCDLLQGSLDVVPGDIVFFPPGFIHAWAFTSEKHIGAHFDMQYNKKLTSHNEDMKYTFIDYYNRDGKSSPVKTMPVFQLHYPGQSPDDGWHIPLITSVDNTNEWRENLSSLVNLWQMRSWDNVSADLQVCEILGWAFKNLVEQSKHGFRQFDDPRIVDFIWKMQDPIELSVISKYGVDEICKQINIGETAFRRQFKEITGRTPHQYIRERQIQQAATLLKKSSMSVRDIAESVGFEDPFHFSRIFNQLMGCSPLKFRHK